ncbi:uncharacterized protein LOC106672459 [Cimex lectularius]|uniref:Ammonium transporter AmtB-like domain-containing protein n=1 Tax=Cimex lectularius TaxID=79782 RepID=A0A8I6SEM5_CIMLE|nr:uncharacterized protein LOC106672459 [Cimex lectularius]
MLYESWPSMFIEVVLVFILRIGFVLVHIGCVPSSSVNLLVMQHLINMAVSTLVFFVIGFPIAVGNDNLVVEVSKVMQGSINVDDLIFNWKIIVVSDAIISTTICGKAHMAGGVLMSMLVSGCIQPTIMYFLWRKIRFFNAGGDNLIFYSYGHTVVMHVFPGAFCLGCILLYGKRVIRISDIDLCSISFNSHSTTIIGYAFIITSMVIEPTLIAKKNVTTIFVNNILAVTIGVMTTSILNSVFRQNSNFFNYWQVVCTFQGALSSLVIISAGLDMMKPYQTLMIAPVGPLLHFIYSKLIFCTIFEDYCKIVGIHGICAAIGAYLSCIQFEPKLQEDSTLDRLMRRSIITTIIFFCGFIIALVIQLILKYTNLLRNNTEKLIHMKAPKGNKNKCPYILPNKNKQLIEPQVHILHTLKNQLFNEKANLF